MRVQPLSSIAFLPTQPVVLFGKEKGEKEEGKESSAYAPSVPQALQNLFRQVPKSENHLHLRGSTPKKILEECMKENGLNLGKIRAALNMLRSDYFDLTDFLNTYRVVPSQVKTPDQSRRAAKALVIEAGKEHVRVLEVRNSVIRPGGADPEGVVLAIEEGLREGQAWVKTNLNRTIYPNLIISAERSHSPEEALAHAKIAIKMGDRTQRPNSLVRGFDISGDESHYALTRFKEAIDYFNQHKAKHNMGLTIHAGETPMSEALTGVQSIKKALEYKADRLGHALQAVHDPKLKQLLKEKKIPIELCPWSNVQVGYVEPYKTHPADDFLDNGLNISASSDNRMMSQIDLTHQLGQLWGHGIVKHWDDVVKLTLNGIEMAFLPETEKALAKKEAIAEFKELETRYAKTIARYLPKAPSNSPRRIHYFA